MTTNKKDPTIPKNRYQTIQGYLLVCNLLRYELEKEKFRECIGGQIGRIFFEDLIAALKEFSETLNRERLYLEETDPSLMASLEEESFLGILHDMLASGF